MEKKRSWRTGIVAGVGLLILLIALGLVYFGKATLTEVSSALGPIALFLSAVGFYLSKDAVVSGPSKPL